MNVVYLLLGGVAALACWRIFLMRTENRTSPEALGWEEDSTRSDESDLLAVELGARIFSSEDSRLIAAETSPKFASWFESERRALALDWLEQVRKRVRQIVREHRRAASQNPGVRPADELKLVSQFLWFEMTSNILYCFIRLRGPRHASTLVGSFLDGAGRVRAMVEGPMPAPMSIEMVKN
jgi:hypothetical protein